MGRIPLFLVFFLLLLATVTLADPECGSDAGDKICAADYACCSRFGYCGFTYDYCAPSRQCQSNCVPFGQVFLRVPATIANLNNYNYELDNDADVQCSKWLLNKPLEWRSRYEWAGFCGPAGPQGRAACGRCLKVSNYATDASIIVRIVDTCGMGGLTLDPKSFKRLDTDGVGASTDSLYVNYAFVECGDEKKLLSTET